jgi:hypothetical protein
MAWEGSTLLLQQLLLNGSRNRDLVCHPVAAAQQASSSKLVAMMAAAAGAAAACWVPLQHMHGTCHLSKRLWQSVEKQLPVVHCQCSQQPPCLWIWRSSSMEAARHLVLVMGMLSPACANIFKL